MLELLMIAVLGVHLLAVDLASVGPLLAVGLQWRGRRRGDAGASPVARRLAAWSMAAAAFGIVLGLAALVLAPHVESEAYRRALEKIPASRWWFVAGELAFYFVCMAAYVGPWRKFERRPVCHALLAILAGTDLMYHFPPLFAVISTLSMRPKFWGLPLDHALYWKLLLEGQTLAMVLHHWLAAISVAAMGAVMLNLRSAKSAAGLATSKWGARIALMATLLQLPVGIGVLLAMPASLENPLLGDDWVATLLFGLSVLLALGLMHHLAMLAMGDIRRGAVIRTAGMMAATIILMTATLQRARHLAEAHVADALRVPSAARGDSAAREVQRSADGTRSVPTTMAAERRGGRSLQPVPDSPNPSPPPSPSPSPSPPPSPSP